MDLNPRPNCAEHRVALVTNPGDFAGPAAMQGLRAAGFLVVEGDSSQAPEILVGEVMRKHGHLDVLINNDVIDDDLVGPGARFEYPDARGPIETFSTDDFTQVLNNLIVRPFAVARAAVVPMKRAHSGVIIFITSCNAVRFPSEVAMYNAARSGATALASSLAKELGPFGILVNSIGPTFFENPTYFPPGRLTAEPDISEMVANEVPLGRLGTTAEMASLIGFLAQGTVPPITGEFIAFSGGWRH